MIQLARLENQTEILMETVENTNIVSIGYWIKLGSRDEKPDQAGFSHFLEHMLFKGTFKRNALEIAKEIDKLGGVMNAYTEHEICCYYCTLPYYHIGIAIDVLSDIIANSVLSEEEIEKEKTVVINEIIANYDIPEECALDLYLADFWGDHPLGRKITAEIDNIKKVTRDKLVEFYADRYIPQNLTISIAGRFIQKNVLDLLNQKLLLKNLKGYTKNRIRPHRQDKKRFVKDQFNQIHIYSGFQID